MRRLTKIGAASAVLVLALAGCAQEDENPDEASQDLCDGGGDGPKVGLAYDVGGRGDQSFNDSAAVGLQKAIDDLAASCTEAEAQDGEAESAREDRLRALAEAGHNPIIGVGFAYSDSVNIVAPDFPDISFGVIDGFDPDEEPNDNVAYLGFAENEGSFLVGVAAATKTAADHVGFVGGVNNDLIKKFEAGFAAGPRSCTTTSR
ncbi:MAG: BMP family lipoprotein, partial [Nocardioides sp.]